MQPENALDSSNDVVAQRIQKLGEIRDLGIDPYPHRFNVSHPAQTILDQVESLIDSEERVTVAGRLMSKRGHGKTGFSHISDRTGRVQVYVRLDRIGEDAHDLYNRLMDIGDYIGVSGTVFRTRTGETTVLVESIILLSKSIRPLPEKWHGLQDIETRYRQRYVDLIVNPGVKEVFLTRSRLIRAIQRFMDGQDFIEVETPVLQPIYGGALARPFTTHHNTLDAQFYLRIADELYLKRLIVGGLERVYEIGRDFRNEGMDRTHNPEFTMLEFYQAYADYNDMMWLTENLIATAVKEATGSTTVTFGEHTIDLSPPWRRVTMLDAIQEFTSIEVQDASEADLRGFCSDHGVHLDKGLSRGKLINEIFEACVEPNLIQPTFIIDYPVEISPLAKKHRTTSGLVERFEAFICGNECANAFSELNDPIDQRERFEDQVALKAEGDEEAHALDDDYIRAMEYGMPPTGGCGIGIDRLMMYITNSPSIKDVILFPSMRPEIIEPESTDAAP
ncbi:MAG: lysine--tRNA ligase [Candidatus Latescibacteria bacterium]|nr:lysine--tRNA ligase [Candidatus Latescibacterota bacterium]